MSDDDRIADATDRLAEAADAGLGGNYERYNLGAAIVLGVLEIAEQLRTANLIHAIGLGVIPQPIRGTATGNPLRTSPEYDQAIAQIRKSLKTQPTQGEPQ